MNVTCWKRDMQKIDKQQTNTGATEHYKGFWTTVSKVKVQGST